MRILAEKDNFLFDRKEVKVVVDAEKNPSFQEAENIISEHFKADKDLIVIKQIKGKFGRRSFLIISFIYKSVQDKERIERKKGKKEEKKEEAGEKP